jgi:hypothetical protein
MYEAFRIWGSVEGVASRLPPGSIGVSNFGGSMGFVFLKNIQTGSDAHPGSRLVDTSVRSSVYHPVRELTGYHCLSAVVTKECIDSFLPNP